MRFWTAAVAILAISLATVGCKFPKITISVSITPQGKANVNNEKTVSEVSPSDVDSTSQQAMNTLIDTEPVLTYDSSSPTQALVTVTTDTGQTFAQTFALTPADASTFAPAAAGTQTYAFAAQNPSAVRTFLQSAAANANATMTVDVQTQATFQGPTDGNQHTIYGRQYTSSGGVANLGSATYVAPGDNGGQSGDVGSIQ